MGFKCLWMKSMFICYTWYREVMDIGLGCWGKYGNYWLERGIKCKMNVFLGLDDLGTHYIKYWSSWTLRQVEFLILEIVMWDCEAALSPQQGKVVQGSHTIFCRRYEQVTSLGIHIPPSFHSALKRRYSYYSPPFQTPIPQVPQYMRA